MKNLTGSFSEDYEYMVQRVFVDKVPTAFPRYNEGEYAVLTKQDFKGAYGYRKTYDNKNGLSDYLFSCLEKEDEGYIFGIASKQYPEANTWYKSKIKGPYTFATLRVNSNWKSFKKVLGSIEEEVILVANEKGYGKEYPFNRSRFYEIPFDVVSHFEEKKDFIDTQCDHIARKSNSLVLFSAGPLSNYMIDRCWKLNKTNRYIDVGSTLDPWTMGKATRKYHLKNGRSLNQIDVL